MDWFVEVLRRYAVFRGRAQRREFWWFVAISLLVSALLSVLDGILGLRWRGAEMGALGALFGLATFLPGVAVAVRRLHDSGRSGWWLLVALVPAVGMLVLVVLLALRGTRGANRHGADPLQGEPIAV